MICSIPMSSEKKNRELSGRGTEKREVKKSEEQRRVEIKKKQKKRKEEAKQ